MTTTWTTIRLFVSSTFNDMHAERDYLIKRVFPELREWCERRELRLVDIDLRWGVTEVDATQNRNVVQMCLRKIDECRPFFICFLGQRYGRVPEIEEISEQTFATFPGLRRIAGQASVTELEVVHALITPFDAPTPNAEEPPKPPPGQCAFFYLRDPRSCDALPRNPPELRNAYLGTVEETERLEAFRQKIIDAGFPIRWYRGDWRDDAGQRTPELALPLTCPATVPGNVEAWRKQWQQAAGIKVEGTEVLDISPQAQAARDYNTKLTRGRLSNFVVSMDNEQDMPLHQRILADLQAAIAERYPQRAKVRDKSDLEREIDQQEEFCFNHRAGYIDRPGVFDLLDDYVGREDDQRLFVLTGEAGIGKSSLLARWLERVHSGNVFPSGGNGRPARRPNCVSGPDAGSDDATIHFRFIGASDGSLTIEMLLGSLLRELQEISGKIHGDIPRDPEKLRAAWLRLLAEAGLRGNTVILLDGLDQLDTGLRDLAWLPRMLPPGVKLIVSYKAGISGAEALEREFTSSDTVLVDTLSPFHDKEHRRQLVEFYLSQYLKQLDEPAIRELIAFPGARNPLFLRTLLAELRVFGTFSALHERIRNQFGSDPQSAFESMLERLERDPAYSAVEGHHVVRLLFGFLAHARRGLSVNELTSLIVDNYPWSGEATEERCEQVRDAVYLYLRQVQEFTARREGRYDLFYESFRDAAARRYADDVISWHNVLAVHYENQARTSPPATSEARYAVRVTDDVKGKLQLGWMKRMAAQMESLLSDRDTDEVLDAETPDADWANPEMGAHIMGLLQPFEDVLGSDCNALQLLLDLADTGSIVVSNGLSHDRAGVLVAQFKARCIEASAELQAEESPTHWPCLIAQPYSELLHHQAQAQLWGRQIDLLVDDLFRSRCIKFFGPGFYIGQLRRVVDVVSSDDSLQPLLNQMRMRLPIDDLTRPLLAILAEGLQSDLEQAASLLLACAVDTDNQPRAAMAIEALGNPQLAPRAERTQSILDACEEALPLVLKAEDKHVRWQAVHAFWSLAGSKDTQLLLKIAEAAEEHPLIRAEAARQLGDGGEPELASRLRRLAKEPVYPLCAMAARSARRIEYRLGTTDALEPIDDWTQRTSFPDDLSVVLKSLGGDPDPVARVGHPKRMIIHVVSRSELSVDSQWLMVELLEKIVRLLPCRLFCEESGTGDVSLSFLRETAELDRRMQVGLSYFQRFQLGAPDFFDITTEFKLARFGVDHPELARKAFDEKQAGRMGSEFIGSVDRARTILESCLGHMESTKSPVATLLTSDVPAYLVARLLGEHQQFLKQAGFEFGLAGISESDVRLFESIFPEPPQQLKSPPENLSYVLIRAPEATGDLFTLDVNYAHSLGARIELGDDSKSQANVFKQFKLPEEGEPGRKIAGQSVLARDRGESSTADGLQRQAIASWQQAFGERDLRLAESLNALARVLQIHEYHAEAIPICLQVLHVVESCESDLQPGETNWAAVGMNNLALSLMKLGRVKEAEFHLSRSVDADPTLSAPHYWLAKLYQQRSDPASYQLEAHHWQRYLDLGPAPPERRQEATARLKYLNQSAGT